MAKSTTIRAGAAPQKGPQDATAQSKKRELLELRIRWKIADEATKRSADERKDLKTRIEALASELKSASGVEHADT